MNDQSKKMFWLLGYTADNYNVFTMTAVLSFQYYVWEAKLKKKIPSFPSLFTEFFDNFCQTFKFNSDIRKSCLKLNYSQCRSLLGARQVADDGDE